MRAIFTTFVLLGISFCTKAQQVDSIYFHLYTDSLKKGTYNYINVDGKTRDGHWLPLDARHLTFTSSDGKWEGNNLVIDPAFNKDSVYVTAVLKQNASIKKTILIYIKRKPDDEKLKTEEEIMNQLNSNSKKSRRKG